jgi:hypothetical protein
MHLKPGQMVHIDSTSNESLNLESLNLRCGDNAASLAVVEASHQALRGGAEAHLMQGDATLQRLAQEIERRKKSRRPKPTPLESPASKLVIRRT